MSFSYQGNTQSQKKREEEIKEKRLKREKEMKQWYKMKEREGIELNIGFFFIFAP